jgi:hypothetical protein
MAKQKSDHLSLYCGTTERIAKQAPVAALSVANSPVYLTDVYPGLLAFFASTSANERFGILEVDTSVLDSSNFLPCEWYLEQISRQRAKTERELHKRLEMYRKNLEKYDAKWKDSLQKIGICVYDGYIPKKAIRKITIYDPASNPTITQAIVSCRISLSDYKKHFARYKALTRWLVGESVSVDDWLGDDVLTVSKEEKELLAEQLQNKAGLDIFYYEPPPKGL